MIRKAIATACCIGMAATGVVAGSTAATADTGAVRSFPINTLGAGWESVTYVDAPGNGYVYVHGKRNGNDAYAVVAESGDLIRQAQLTDAGDVTGMAATTDGIMYVCHEKANVIRVDSAGVQTTVAVPTTSTWDCRRGTDGAVWFGFSQNSRAYGLGRVTSSGSLATLDLASQRSDATNSLTIDTLVPGGATGTVSFLMSENARVAPFDREKTLLGVARYSDANGITLPNVTEWRLGPGIPAPFTTLAVAGSNTYSSGFNQLERLASPPTATAVPVTHNIGGLESGADGTLWASLSTAPVLWHYNSDGQLIDSYGIPTGIPPRGMRIDPAGDLWLVLGQSGFARMSGGATPSIQEQPSTSNAQGSTAGTEITASPGTWTNNPSTYTYQWQECSKADGSDCTDIPGATSEKYAPTDAQAGKYVRVVVTATNISGVSQQAATTPVQVAQRTTPPTPTPPAAGGSTVATGSTAAIGNSQTMELDVPKKTRRNKRKLYEVFFTTTDVPGTVTFTFKRKRRMKTVTVPIEDGIADYRWKTPKKWPRGKTRVTATYIPSAGSPYTTAAVTDRVKVRKRKR